MKVGLLIGRFQPFHNGHLDAVKQAFSQVSRLIIGIGSSQYSREKDNPFTAEERKEMIKLCLDEIGIDEDKYTVVNIPDIHDYDRWVEHVVSLAPKFDVVFTANELTEELFSKKDFVVVRLKWYPGVSSTDVRAKIRAGGDWESLVPKATVKYLKSINGEDRIRQT